MRACVRCNGNCAHTFFSVVLLLFYVMKVCLFCLPVYRVFFCCPLFQLLLSNFRRLYPVCCYLALLLYVVCI